LWIERLGVKALICLSIGSPQDRLGFLFLMDTRAARPWRTEEIELVESFVNRAAVALVNANLHKQLEWAAALEERQRIAANMHDGLGQTLSLLGLRVDQVSELVASGAIRASTQELNHIRELIEQATSEVRRSIASLQEAPRPQRSLQDQLGELLDQYAQEPGPPVYPSIEIQEPLFLPPEYEDQILPVVQEALLNARYHAQAHQVRLILERQADQVSIIVQDDGRGFDLKSVQNNSQGHFGLSIMRARATRIGAGLQVDSAPGHGTRVILAWAQNGHRHPGRHPVVQTEPTARPALAVEAEP
jgi:two-component system nitrate/nitrite sensor histidine kinase NarX